MPPAARVSDIAMHAPPHGPGVAIDGSRTVSINGQPARRMGYTLLQAIGPAGKIVNGEPAATIGG